jgi:hypothetical protein
MSDELTFRNQVGEQTVRIKVSSAEISVVDL